MGGEYVDAGFVLGEGKHPPPAGCMGNSQASTVPIVPGTAVPLEEGDRGQGMKVQGKRGLGAVSGKRKQ